MTCFGRSLPRYNLSVIVGYILLVCHLVLFSWLGVTTRILLSNVLFDQLFPEQLVADGDDENGAVSGSPNPVHIVLFREIFANGAGCLLMGMLFETMKHLSAAVSPHRSQEGPGLRERTVSTVQYTVMADCSFLKRVNVGLSTGFCGSLTTFSSWQYSAAAELSRGFIVTFVLYQVTGLVVALNLFFVGRYVGCAVVWAAGKIPRSWKCWSAMPADAELGGWTGLQDRDAAVEYSDPLHTEEQTCESICHIPMAVKVVLESAIVLAAVFSTLIGIVGLALSPVSLFLARYAFSLCLAPLGCIMRFLVCKGNKLVLSNRKIPFIFQIPLFTLLVNVLGSLVAAMANIGIFALSLATITSPYAALLLEGITVGFAGSLTTVSTFVQELHVIRSKFLKCVYMLASIIITSVLLVSIIAPFVWIVARQSNHSLALINE